MSWQRKKEILMPNQAYYKFEKFYSGQNYEFKNRIDGRGVSDEGK